MPDSTVLLVSVRPTLGRLNTERKYASSSAAIDWRIDHK